MEVAEGLGPEQRQSSHVPSDAGGSLRAKAMGSSAADGTYQASGTRLFQSSFGSVTLRKKSTRWWSFGSEEDTARGNI